MIISYNLDAPLKRIKTGDWWKKTEHANEEIKFNVINLNFWNIVEVRVRGKKKDHSYLLFWKEATRNWVSRTLDQDIAENAARRNVWK